jgi:hypothetical protein
LASERALSVTLLQIMAAAAASLCALLFLVAGIDKLRHRALLPGVIANYRLLPAALVGPASALLPLAELAVAAGLLAGLMTGWTMVPALAAALLLLAFAGAMAINILRGRRHIDCGCGHAGLRQRLGWGRVARNIGLAVLLLPLLVSSAPLAAGDLAVALAAGSVVYLLMLLFAALASLPGLPSSQARG